MLELDNLIAVKSETAPWFNCFSLPFPVSEKSPPIRAPIPIAAAPTPTPSATPPRISPADHSEFSQKLC